jgi:hypothetical protein
MNNFKRHYIPPEWEVYPVAIESDIALQSPVMVVNMEEWKPDETVTPDTGDIYLPI